MKKLILGLLLTSMAANASPIFGGRDFFDDFPHNQTYTLSTGQVVKLPTHFYRAQGLNIIGTIDRAFAEQYVDLNKYEITTLPGQKNRAMVFLAAILTSEHDFGPHNDFGVNILVSPKNKPQDDRGPSSLLTTYVLAVAVYGDLAISNIADREIWGMNKMYSHFEIQHDDRRLKFQISDSEGQWANVDFRLPKLDIHVPLLMKTFTYSQTRPDLVAPVFFDGNFNILPGENHSSIRFNSKHSIGAWMNTMDFCPIAWQYSPRIQGAYLGPQ